MKATESQLQQRMGKLAARQPQAVAEPLLVGPHVAYAYILVVSSPAFWAGAAVTAVGACAWLGVAWMPAAMVAQGYAMFVIGAALALLALAWRLLRFEHIRQILEEGKLVLESGVFWRTADTVPFNLVLNCTCTQSPLQARFGAGTLHVQLVELRTIRVPWVIHPALTRDILLTERPRVMVGPN